MQGNGSLGHIGGELFKQAAGIDIVHVPYRGAAPAIQDLIAGHVTMLFDIVPLAMPQLAGSKVRALAVTSPQRVVTIPDVATMTEAGLSEVEGGPWFGLLVPAGTPRAVIDWLNRETKKAFNASDAAAQFIAQGLVLATQRISRPTFRRKRRDGARLSRKPVFDWTETSAKGGLMPQVDADSSDVRFEPDIDPNLLKIIHQPQNHVRIE